MTQDSFDPLRAATWIAAQRRNNASLARLPAAVKPMTEDQGYAVQAALRDLLAERGRPIGWKIGATTAAMRDLLNVPGPCAGEMHENGLYRNHARLARDAFIRPGLECEIAMELGRPLGGTATIDAAEAGRAVARIFPAAEIVDDRYGEYRSFGAPALIADFFFHAGLVLGDPIDAWQGIDLAAVTGVTRVNGEDRLRGRGADVLGHPLAALAWLANRVTALGCRLEAGQIIMTGSLPLPYWAERGDRVEIALAGLGSVTIDID